MPEIEEYFDRFDDVQMQVILGIAARISNLDKEKWTGKICFEVNVVSGTIGDMHVNRGEVIRFKKKRRIRSTGIV